MRTGEKQNINKVEAVVIGGSAGSFNIIYNILNKIPENYPYPILITIHRQNRKDKSLEDIFASKTNLSVGLAEDKEPILPGTVYFAPGGYHMQVNEDNTICLSIDAPVSYAIPSIDVLFESASDVYKDKLVSVLLSGANEDGAQGSKAVKENNGICIIQDPETADSPEMPFGGLKATEPDFVFSPDEICEYLIRLGAVKR